MTTLEEFLLILKGGPRSGNWGHVGRPGKKGGSQPGAGHIIIGADRSMGREEILSARERHREREQFYKQRQKIINDFENKIRHQSYESMAIVDREGNILSRQDGSKSEIVLTEDSIRNLRGNTLTHNHPSSNSFSSADIITSVEYGVKEVRAVSAKYDYSMRFEDHIRVRDLKDAITYHDTNIKNEFWPKINSGQMTVEEANSTHHHELWTRIAAEYNNSLIYERSPVK